MNSNQYKKRIGFSRDGKETLINTECPHCGFEGCQAITEFHDYPLMVKNSFTCKCGKTFKLQDEYYEIADYMVLEKCDEALDESEWKQRCDIAMRKFNIDHENQ